MSEKRELETIKNVLLQDDFLPIGGRFDEIVTHIEEHKYFVNQNIPWEITWDQAVFSWYENIFLDVKRILKSGVATFALREKSNVEFYFKTMDHWHLLKEENPRVTYDCAVNSYIKKFAKPYLRWLRHFV